jgi:hypothetical protein
MTDDPDARLQAAEPSLEPVIEAPPMSRPAGSGPYHEAIAPELVDDLQLAIGKGLALIEAEESLAALAIVEALARYVDEVLSGGKRLPSDGADAALALACLLGHAIGRELGWGWAHVRRTRSPGIVVVSPDRRYAAAPRAVIDRALSGDGGQVVRAFFARLAAPAQLPAAEAGRYLRLS